VRGNRTISPTLERNNILGYLAAMPDCPLAPFPAKIQ
jgi:hypothetical protein